MPKIHKRIEIKAPAHKIYNFIEDSRREPEWIKSMAEVSNVIGTGQGSHFNWTWKMVGLPLRGESTNIEDIPDRKIVMQTTGGIESTWTFELEPHQDVTEVDLDIDYRIPVPVLGKLAEKVVASRNEHDTELALQKLKRMMEV